MENSLHRVLTALPVQPVSRPCWTPVSSEGSTSAQTLRIHVPADVTWSAVLPSAPVITLRRRDAVQGPDPAAGRELVRTEPAANQLSNHWLTCLYAMYLHSSFTLTTVMLSCSTVRYSNDVCVPSTSCYSWWLVLFLNTKTELWMLLHCVAWGALVN